jgi:hypothetical protein
MAVQLWKKTITKRALVHPRRLKAMPPKRPRIDASKLIK